MFLSNTYTIPKSYVKRTPFVEWRDWCGKQNPQPFYCEAPDDLKTKSVSYSGAPQTYTLTSSMGSLASIGTSTTTTL